jgi:PAS domain S-box-containing protein
MLREPFTETAAEPLPMMLWRARPDLSCEFVSRQWLDFTGCTPEQALGDGWSRPIHPEDLPLWLDTCVRSFDAREPFEVEYRLRRRDGEYRWMLDRGQPRYSRDGVFLGFVGASIDIDERKRAEHELGRSLERERKLRIAIEEASRVKDGFLANVLSELQSPARAIATWAAHLRGQVPAEPARALDAIERNARTQERIIASLLDVARVAQGERAAARGAHGAPLLGGVRVLIVDHDPQAREAMAKMLGIAGAETKAASSSAEALEALAAFRPDVLLSDVHMHGGEGYLLIRAVRALPAERGGCLRAAALTARDEAEDGARAVAAGYDAQLAKPVEPVALLATVARLAQPAGV